jgi:acyl dehydratase
MHITELTADAEQPLAVSDWLTVTQDMIDRFAAVTGDAQWIHTDPVRAASQSPFGTTIAHGFLTLALVSRLASTALAFGGVRMSVNYGLNRVRFTAPVLSGSRIRARFAVGELTPLDGGVQVTWGVTIEREGSDKPCCVAEWVVRYYA